MNARLNAAQALSGDIGAGSVVVNDYQIQADAIDGGHRLTITRGSEVQTMDVLDGKNGADGKDGSPGADGRDGIDGKDGAPGAVQTVNGEAPDENGNVQVSGLPYGASANQQLVTDSEGVVKWEEKPFYSFQDCEEITWDGDTAGREEVSLSDYAFYKISDTIYPPDGIIGKTFTIMRNGAPEDIVITNEIFCDISSNYPGTWTVFYNDSPVLGSGPALDFVGSSGGLYYLKTDSYYVSSLSLVSTVLKEIDPIYLPAIPAEKLPAIPAEKLPAIPAEKLPKQYKISINPDNSCSVSFTDAYNMVNSGLATFTLVAWGAGKYMQISYTIGANNISGTIQRAIIAELIHITGSASGLSIAELVWGESSGISVTSKTISAQ